MKKKIVFGVVLLLIVIIGILVWKHGQHPKLQYNPNDNSQQECLNAYYKLHPDAKNLKSEDVISASHCYIVVQ